MHPREFQRAIVTGASSGLGEEFAVQLAPRLQEIILLARRTERLTILSETLRKINPELKVYLHPGDLILRETQDTLRSNLEELPVMPTLLVNNADMGDYGEFAAADWDKTESMLMLNIVALTRLTHLLLPMLQVSTGAIINISSLASDLPIPDFAVYAASKSYVLSFSEALRAELKDRSVQVLTVCPGPVHTEFGKVARRPGFSGNMMPVRSLFDTSRELVVSESLQALRKNKARVYPGVQILGSHLLLSFLPGWFIRWVMGKRPRRVQALHNLC